MEIRPVRPDEHEPAGRLVVSAYAALSGNHMTAGYAAELADVERRARQAEVLVAVNGDLLGCVTFVPDATSPWAEMLEAGESGIRMLAVLPAAQGRGVGRALVDECIARARQLGHTGLMLHTTPWMAAAHHVYQKAGFRRAPERDWTPVPEVPLLAYHLPLGTDQIGQDTPVPPRPQ